MTPGRVPAKWYIILFATRGADGKPTPIPGDRLARAKQINAAHSGEAAKPAAIRIRKLEAGKIIVEGDDGTMEDRSSIGASGHFVRLDCPSGPWALTQVQIYGSRLLP